MQLLRRCWIKWEGNKLRWSLSASRFTSAIRWPPPRPVRPFPSSFVSFRRLHISSHALSLPAPCWAGKWLCRRAGSHAPQNKERTTERRRSKWKQGSLGVGCTSREPPSVCATGRGLFLKTLECLKRHSSAGEKKVRRGKKYPRVSFSKLLHISSTARQRPLYWKMVERCKCGRLTQLGCWLVASLLKFHSRFLCLFFFFFVV